MGLCTAALKVAGGGQGGNAGVNAGCTLDGSTAAPYGDVPAGRAGQFANAGLPAVKWVYMVGDLGKREGAYQISFTNAALCEKVGRATFFSWIICNPGELLIYRATYDMP